LYPTPLERQAGLTAILNNFVVIMHPAVSKKRVTGTKNSIQEFRKPELIVKYLIGQDVLITALMTEP
jgi:hypothetical protein